MGGTLGTKRVLTRAGAHTGRCPCRYGGGFGYAFELDDEPIARVGPGQYDNYSHMEVPAYSEYPSVSARSTLAGCEHSRGRRTRARA
jgi:hypothetical protein